MKKIISILLLIVVSGVQAQGLVMGKEGHGGDIIACYENTMSDAFLLSSVEVLDISEGKLLGLNYDEGFGPSVRDYLDKALSGIVANSRIKTAIKQELDLLARKIIFTDSGSYHFIPEIDDEYTKYTAIGSCYKHQIAVYYDRFILIQSVYWGVMDNFNRAALLLHEAVYKVFRDYGQTNSFHARQLVYLLMAENRASNTLYIHELLECIDSESNQCPQLSTFSLD